MTHLDVVTALMKVAPPILVPRHLPNHCITASRHGMAALDYFGVDARPRKVQVVAGNDAWKEWFDSEQELPMPDPAWSVGIDLDSQREGGYPGHVVIVVTLESGSQGFVDLNAGQFARPDHGIVVPPAVALPLPDGWDVEGEACVWSSNNDDGARTWLVHRYLKERDFATAPDWKRSPPYAGEIIRAMKKELS